MGFTRLHRRLKESLFLLLLPAVMWLFINASVNMHFHILANGYIIEHAHPYKKDPSGSMPFQTHHHSRAELILFSLFSNPVANFVILIFAGLCLFSVSRILNPHYRFIEPAREYFQVNNYHAPPLP
jgi:4-amino-4-deoxy-L-arabinose transferase-like glycosyltransferase